MGEGGEKSKGPRKGIVETVWDKNAMEYHGAGTVGS